MRSRQFVLLDGFQFRRAPGHWQGRLAELLAGRGERVDYLTLPDPDIPRRASWERVVVPTLGEHTVVVAQGLAALLMLDLAARAAMPAVGGALLVAPPAPGTHPGDIARPLDPAVIPDSVRAALGTVLIVHPVEDPYNAEGASARYAQPLAIESVCIDHRGPFDEMAGGELAQAALHWCLDGRWPDHPSPEGAGSRHPAAHRPSASRASGPDQAEDLVRAGFVPRGKSLGVLVGSDVDDEVRRRIAAAVAAAGLPPERRVATVRPRLGEHVLRAEDLIDFADRYGHEYSLAVFSADPRWGDAEQQRIATAMLRNGCGVVWLEGHHLRQGVPEQS